MRLRRHNRCGCWNRVLYPTSHWFDRRCCCCCCCCYCCCFVGCCVVWFGCVLTRCFERTREVPLPLLIAWAPIISLLLVWTHPTNKLYHLLAYYLFVCCYVSNVLYNNFRRRNRQSRGSLLLESTRVASKFYH